MVLASALGRSRRLERALAALLVAYFAIAVAVGGTYHGSPPPVPFPAPSGNRALWTLPFVQGSYPNTRLTAVGTERVGSIRVKVVRVQPEGTSHYGVGSYLITFPRVRERYALSVWVRGNAAAAGERATIILHERTPAATLTIAPAYARRLSTQWQRLVVRGRVQRAGDTLDAFVVMGNDLGPPQAVYLGRWQLARVATPRGAKAAPK